MNRTEALINRDWLFSACNDDRLLQPGACEEGFEQINLPHSNAALPVNYFSERRTQYVSWYRKHLCIPRSQHGDRIIVDFDGVMMVADVYMNGQHVLSHRGGYTGFSADITRSANLSADTDNVLAVRVDSRLHPDIPPCGKVMDYQAFGGIYRDVRLRIVPACHIDDVFVRTPDPLKPGKTVQADLRIRNAGQCDWQGALRLDLLDDSGRRVASGSVRQCRVSAGAGGGPAPG